jgi:hypothetical protein
MKNILIEAFAALTLTTLAAFGADNFLGTWKLNLAKSKIEPAKYLPKSLTVVREASDGGVKSTRTGERTDGTPINSTYTAKYDGKDYPVTGETSWDTIAIKSVNANVQTWTVKKTNGKYHATVRSVVSKDGKTLTSTGHGTDAEGKPTSLTLVYEKQ